MSKKVGNHTPIWDGFVRFGEVWLAQWGASAETNNSWAVRLQEIMAK